MATVNIGRIKFVWQGAYNNATAYVADDVVSYNGSSYICILASTGNLPTNTTYWNQMSSAGTNGTNGTNGTDVGTVITTQGDLLYRDASGLQRLGAGTSGQFLKTQGAGANPVWDTPTAGAMILLSSTTASSSSSISFDGHYTSDYDVYEFVGSDIVPNTDNESIRWRIRVGNADKTDSYYYGGYNPNMWLYNDGSGYYNSPSSTGWAEPSFQTYSGNGFRDVISLNGNYDSLTGNNRARYNTSETGHTLNFKITAYNPRSSREYKHYKIECIWNCDNTSSNGKTMGMNGYFSYSGTSSAHSGISVFCNSGNFTSGKFYLYGLKNS